MRAASSARPAGVADTRVGRRGAIAVAMSLPLTPGFLFAAAPATLFGRIGHGSDRRWRDWLGPAYLAAAFPTALRGRGAGTGYHLAAALGALAPQAIAVLRD